MTLRVWLAAVTMFSCAPSAPRHVAQAPSAVTAHQEATAKPPAVPFPVFKELRLPRAFEPRGYQARLTIEDSSFTGHIEIAGDITEEVSLIWLHGMNLVVKKATATRDGLTAPLEFSSPRDDQLIGLRSKAPLSTGRWTIAIDYAGVIADLEPQRPTQLPGGTFMQDQPAMGAFRRVNGKDTYVFTQSEPIFARRIFPCIDEPDRKVPWQLTLDVRKDLVAASNTNIVRETTLDKTYKRVEFAQTLPLPSYLIAFAVGPFDVVDGGKAKSGVPIRLLVQRGRADEFRAAPPNAKRILDELEAWIGIPYPYGKLDLVVVPHFGWGAMENPGLVTFNDELLARDNSGGIITHELAHQWFGNLVTMAWWDDIWLNESFASWMWEKLAFRDGEPFASRRFAMLWQLRDGVRVRRDIKGNESLAFGEYSEWSAIEQGMGVLRILDASVGPEPFRRVLRQYLTTHAHGNVKTADLVAAIEKEAGKPLAKAIDSLLDGVMPTIEPALDCKGAPKLHLKSVDAPTLVCVAYDGDGKRVETCASVDTASTDIPLPAKACPRWVMPNAGGNGLYRVEWTKQLVEPLLARAWPSLSPVERAALFDEMEDGHLKLAVFVKFAQADSSKLGFATHYLEDIRKYVPDDLRPRFDAWVQSTFTLRDPEGAFASRPEESPNAERQRVRVVELLAATRDPRLVPKALSLAADRKKWPLEFPYWRAVLTLAANADQKLAIALLDDLAAAPSGQTQWSSLNGVLSQVPSILAHYKAKPEKLLKLGEWDRSAIFAKACDKASRTDLVAISTATGESLRELLPLVDECIAERKQLEPIFRRWLGSKRRQAR